MAVRVLLTLITVCILVKRGTFSPLVENRSEREERSVDEFTTCGTSFTSGAGAIVLPTEDINGTSCYPANYLCEWTITAGEGEHVVFNSEYFALEESDNCQWDYLEIEEDGSSARFCGYQPFSFVSLTNQVIIRFRSDESYEDMGFILNFQTFPDEGEESKCNSFLTGGPGEVASVTSPGFDGNYEVNTTCSYRIMAEAGSFIEIIVQHHDFQDSTCTQESLTLYRGISSHGEKLYEVCREYTSPGLTSDPQMIPYAENMFVEFKSTYPEPGTGFKLLVNFNPGFVPTTTPAPTTPSPVGGNADCSGYFDDIQERTFTTTGFPNDFYQPEKHCILVFRTQIAQHIVQFEITSFDLEESENCMFDSVEIFAGERRESPSLGKYCGKELSRKILRSRGNSMRWEFKTDESFETFGYELKVSFVPEHSCTCNEGEVCLIEPTSITCIPGVECYEDDSLECENGGICVETGFGDEACHCPQGFSGDYCETGDAAHANRLSFTVPPLSKKIRRGDTSTFECQVDDDDAEYDWMFKNTLITLYNSDDGFGYRYGGLLQIDRFREEHEGVYSCLARAPDKETAEFTFQLTLAENCDLSIRSQPTNEVKKVGETLILPCFAREAIDIRWLKDNFPIDYEANPRITMLTNDYLRIDKLQESDTGRYTCELQSSARCFSSRSGFVTVLDVTPFRSVCGRSQYEDFESASDRISSGSEAKNHSSPWHVTFRTTFYTTDGIKVSFCGGTLISKTWILTAAHCITNLQNKFGRDFNRNNVDLYLGTNNCEGLDGIKVPMKRTITHPDFQKNGVYLDNDVALIELLEPVQYTNRVKPMCLEPKQFIDETFFRRQVGERFGRVVGCGRLKNRGIRPDWLREVYVPYVPRSTCQAATTKAFTDSMICAGFEVERKGDSCGGDSGGSLVMQRDGENRWIQVGIVSWGVGCDRLGTYGYYTDVGYFYPWIKHHTNFDEEDVD